MCSKALLNGLPQQAPSRHLHDGPRLHVCHKDGEVNQTYQHKPKLKPTLRGA